MDVDTRDIVDMGTNDYRAKADAYATEKSERIQRGQQLFARIKRTSKYYGQGDKGALFPVMVCADCGDYAVQGGPGGQYRLRDVSLFVVSAGREVRISS